MQDSLAAAVVKQFRPMGADQFIAARVPSETKARLRALADQQELSESALLKRLIDLMLPPGDGTLAPKMIPTAGLAGPAARLTIRLRPDDQMLLRERAAARGMPAATYVSVLTRAHLRNLAPLPKEELAALKKTVADLGQVGRLLNQMARAANRGDRVIGLDREGMTIILKVCEALRDHVKGLLARNLKSWEQGYADPNG